MEDYFIVKTLTNTNMSSSIADFSHKKIHLICIHSQIYKKIFTNYAIMLYRVHNEKMSQNEINTIENGAN